VSAARPLALEQQDDRIAAPLPIVINQMSAIEATGGASRCSLDGPPTPQDGWAGALSSGRH